MQCVNVERPQVITLGIECWSNEKQVELFDLLVKSMHRKTEGGCLGQVGVLEGAEGSERLPTPLYIGGCLDRKHVPVVLLTIGLQRLVL